VLRNSLRKVITEFVAKRIEPAPGVPAELQALSVSGLFMTLLGWWLERRPDLSADMVDELFSRLLAGSLKVS